jgi:retinol-binding protein 3
MHLCSLRAALAALVLAATAPVIAAASSARDAVVDEALVQLKEQYVFPDKFGAIEQNVRKHQAAGEYAAAPDDKAFAALLTSHLQEVTRDKHMSLKYLPNARSRRPAAFTSTPAQRDEERRDNYGVRKLEVLPGNVGYIELTGFHDNAQISGDTIVGAMAFLANTDAMIIDLRSNRGGGETMQMLASYFVEGTVELMELRYRNGLVMHAMAQPHVPGKRYLNKPVYILTSGKTFSAGEAFADAMHSLKRATLVGATTRGGGNPNTLVPLGDDYLLSIPIGQSVNPVTGGSWDGVGVAPDVAVDEKAALGVAHRKALAELRERTQDETLRASLAKQLDALDKA